MIACLVFHKVIKNNTGLEKKITTASSHTTSRHKMLTSPIEKIPFLTLFTTFTNMAERREIEKKTIQNWSWLNETIRCVALCDDMAYNTVNRELDKHSWIRKKVSKSIKKLPIVKNMFVDVMNISHTPYYGYSNSDMLFSKDMLPTIHAIHKYHQETQPNRGFLIVGGRWNINSDIQNVTRQSKDHVEIRRPFITWLLYRLFYNFKR